MIPQSNDLQQIQTAFISINDDAEKEKARIDKEISKVNDKISEITKGTKTYSGGNCININNSGKIDFVNTPGYITNASIPSVNNGKLTIKKNGTNVAEFTANQSSNVEADITVPTKTSELTNNSNFVTDANYVHTDYNFTSDFRTGLNSFLTNGTMELYLCETNGWVKNKVARVNVTNNPVRKGYFFIYFKRLNWYYDGSYCTVSFSDDPDTKYNLIIVDMWNTGNYGALSSCCFGFGLYLCRVSGSTLYAIPLDNKQRYVPYYGSGVVPEETETFFRTTAPTTIYSQDAFDYFDKGNNAIPGLLPTMLIKSSTKWYGINSSGGTGSSTGSYNGIPFSADGNLIYEGEYTARRVSGGFSHCHIEDLNYHGYVNYSGTTTMTNDFQTLFTHPVSLARKTLVISARGSYSNYTFCGSLVLNPYNTYGYNFPVYYGSSSHTAYWIGVTVNNGEFKMKTIDAAWASRSIVWYVKVYN